ncbi:MAG: hypothetical protein DCC58_08145 [Chloroflexi bacterium]|nr:MAG: hypothetical protein DCC58_08145 [Chloroflexota bacterium]
MDWFPFFDEVEVDGDDEQPAAFSGDAALVVPDTEGVAPPLLPEPAWSVAPQGPGNVFEISGIDPLLAQELENTNALLAECQALLDNLETQQAEQPSTLPNMEFANSLNQSMGQAMDDIDKMLSGELSDQEMAALLEEYQARTARLDALSGAHDLSSRMRSDALQSMRDMQDQNSASQYRIWSDQEQLQADAALDRAELAGRRGEDATSYLQQFIDSTERADHYSRVARDYTPEDR